MSKEVFAIILGGLVYSLVSFAYMQNTFVNKDVMALVLQRLDNIEKKIDDAINKLGHRMEVR